MDTLHQGTMQQFVYFYVFIQCIILCFGIMKILMRKVEAVTSEPPVENGLPSKEEEDEQVVRELAARVVDDVVKRASEAAEKRCSPDTTPPVTHKNRPFNIQRLPTIQIDTVQSPPPSPDEFTPPDEQNEILEEPIDESDIQLDLETAEQEPDNSSGELRESIKSYVEDILSQAMVLAEKKLQFAGLPEDDEEDEEQGPSEPVVQSPSSSRSADPEPVPEPEKEEEETVDESEIRAAAEKVVQEVITKASETAEEKLENELSGLSFPGLPSIQIDTVLSAPPSPDEEEGAATPQRRWNFTMDNDEKKEPESGRRSEKRAPIKFDDAPEDVQEMATSLVKEIVGKAIAKAEEKTAPTVPFNFEDVDLMKTSGPWYIRAREALIRLLRTACFCTPRRTDS